MTLSIKNDGKDKKRTGRMVLVPLACLCLGGGLLPALAQNAVPVPAAVMAAAPVPPPGTTLTLVAPEMPVSPVAADPAAQTSPESEVLDETVLLATAEAKSHVRDSTVLPESLATLFFTAWQHALLQEAKIGFNTSLAAGGSGSSASEDGELGAGLREVSLGGIAFADAMKWTVWLNGVRVTPGAIPQQVLDIKVSRSYIDLKWFDNYTNKIYPIRLRPQERFNLDSRIFLPGTGVEDGAM